jgi:hypothetical protein
VKQEGITGPISTARDKAKRLYKTADSKVFIWRFDPEEDCLMQYAFGGDSLLVVAESLFLAEKYAYESALLAAKEKSSAVMDPSMRIQIMKGLSVAEEQFYKLLRASFYGCFFIEAGTVASI